MADEEQHGGLLPGVSDLSAGPERIDEHDASIDIPLGKRIYAIGDVHGRDDLLTKMIDLISADNSARTKAECEVLLLGDVIDKGPSSAKVVQRCLRYTELSDRFKVLKGNHEAVLAAILAGKMNDGLDDWLKMGGDATLRSWRIREDVILGAGKALLRAMRNAIPPTVAAWMSSLPTHYQCGRVLFVHAGIRPGVPITRQKEHDLLWIGDDFLDSSVDHPLLIIHGHRIYEDGPEVLNNRIGLDTGAHRTGTLTAIGLEARKRWFLQAHIAPDGR